MAAGRPIHTSERVEARSLEAPATSPTQDPRILRMVASAVSDRGRVEAAASAQGLEGRVTDTALSTREGSSSSLERVRRIADAHFSATETFITTLPDGVELATIADFQQRITAHIEANRDICRQLNERGLKPLSKKCDLINSVLQSLFDQLQSTGDIAKKAAMPTHFPLSPLLKDLSLQMINGVEVKMLGPIGTLKDGCLTGIKVGERHFAMKQVLRKDKKLLCINEIAMNCALPIHKNLCRAIEMIWERGAGKEESVLLSFERGLIDLRMLSRKAGSTFRILSLLPQVLEGLHTLHTTEVETAKGKKIGIVHGDLKLSNLLLFPGNLVKIADFGITGYSGDRCKGHTYHYASPESMNEQRLQPANDIWSFGVLCAIVLLKEVPFSIEFTKSSDFTNQDKVDQILDPLFLKEYAVLRTRYFDVDGTLRTLIKKCLRVNPMERPTASDLLQDPFILRVIRGDLKPPALTEEERAASRSGAASGGGAAGGGGAASGSVSMAAGGERQLRSLTGKRERDISSSLSKEAKHRRKDPSE